MSDIHPTDDRELAERCQLRIERLMKAVPGIGGVLIATRDGFEVAMSLHSAQSPAKIAAMSSSLLSVADAMAVAGQISHCRNVVIEGDQGRILMMDIPNRRTQLLMTVFCLPTASLGQVLWPVRECSQDIGRSLDAEVHA